MKTHSTILSITLLLGIQAQAAQVNLKDQIGNPVRDMVKDLKESDEMEKHYNVDARRVYVTGFSLGGRGTWSVAIDHPEIFAAIVPVAGSYGHPERISRIKDVPVWVFHGDSSRCR